MRFPPSRRDSPLVAGVLFDLLARERGESACLRLARQPAKDPVQALHSAFGASPPELVSMWRAHLDRVASPRPGVTPLA